MDFLEISSIWAYIFSREPNCTISSVAGAVVSVASVVAYIITEGKVDAEGVKRNE